jgi:alpha-galactosidase
MNGFMLEYDGYLFSETNGFSSSEKICEEEQSNGSIRATQIYYSKTGDIRLKNISVIYPDCLIKEKWIEVENIGQDDIVINRIDSLHGLLPEDKYRIKYFLSSWGKECTPVDEPLDSNKVLQVTGGRSSLGIHPWFSLSGESGAIITCSIAWSGNWIARFEQTSDNCCSITCGLNNWCFEKTLKTGQIIEGIHVIYSGLFKGSPEDTSLNFTRWGKKYWYPHNDFLNDMPVEWNHWWPYEDRYINEDVFKANVDICSDIGINICTLDAGWFGSSSDRSNWYKVRGDWHTINQDRFPSGIKDLADHTHSKGLKFGIWCEIEALGEEAALSSIHPEFIAKRNEKNLGYVCFGNPEARKWAYSVLRSLITEYKADWIKLDFNLDPGAGCNRTDHGHGSGDGLYEHYLGYYKILDEVRADHPDVVLENCSSGGLRVDLGMMKHTHVTFISDLDYPVHALQVFWGTAMMLHPSVCLQWSWSQTIDNKWNNIVHEPVTEDTPIYKFDYYIRNSMMKNPGISYRLPDMPVWCLERLKYHIDLYKNKICRFVKNADFYHLSEQAQRTGEGDRWNSFAFVLADKSEAVVFIFRLPGGEEERVVKLNGLDADSLYRLDFLDKKMVIISTGRELTGSGILLDSMDEESSEIIFIVKANEC